MESNISYKLHELAYMVCVSYEWVGVTCTTITVLHFLFSTAFSFSVATKIKPVSVFGRNKPKLGCSSGHWETVSSTKQFNYSNLTHSCYKDNHYVCVNVQGKRFYITYNFESCAVIRWVYRFPYTKNCHLWNFVFAEYQINTLVSPIIRESFSFHTDCIAEESYRIDHSTHEKKEHPVFLYEEWIRQNKRNSVIRIEIKWKWLSLKLQIISLMFIIFYINLYNDVIILDIRLYNISKYN